MKNILFIIIVFQTIIISSQNTFTFNGGGSWTQASNWDIYPGTVITDTDTVILQGGATVVIENGISILNAGTINNIGDLRIDGSIINDGYIVNEVGTISSYGNFTNNGEFENKDRVRLEDISTFINNGQINNLSNGDFNDSGQFINGNLNRDGDVISQGDIVNEGIFWNDFGSFYNYLGSTITNNSGTFRTEAEFINFGDITNNAFFISFNNWENQGIINNESEMVFNSGGLVSTLGNLGSIINNGTINSSLIFSNVGSLINNGTFTNNFTINNEGSFINIGLLRGANISHSNDFTNQGILAPGPDDTTSGIYFFNNNYISDNNSKIQLKFDAFNNVGSVSVDETINLSGDLEIILLGGFSPINGDVFEIITANTVVNEFSNLNLPSLSSGLEWNIIYNSNSVLLTVNSVLSSDNFILSQFSLHPNPAKDNITIEIKEGIKLQNIKIYNSLGQFIVSSKELQINTSQLNTGLYYLEIETDKGKASKKLIIE